MKTYFINLDRSPDRLTYMTKALNELGLDYERVAAVDGRALSREEIAQVYQHAPGTQFLDPGSIACSLSHRKVWERIVAADDEYALVLEDDVIFGENAKAILADTAWIPQGTDLLRLETFRRHTVRGREPVATVRDRAIYRLHHIHNGTGAYIVSKAAAGRLLSHMTRFSYAVDYVLFDPHCPEFCGIDILQMVPAVCIQSALAPPDLRGPGLSSVIQATRKTVFATGLRRFFGKVARELAKQRLKLTGRLFDRSRGTKTGRIPFR
ncbi:MAG: glycosyltransferase family 25 protein [Oricola sp.]